MPTQNDAWRFVADTNVLVSSLIFPGALPNRALKLAFRQGKILLSHALRSELVSVIIRPKFSRYVTSKEATFFLKGLLERSQEVEPEIQLNACCDPKDNMVLELAVAGGANCILTGDADLLALHPFRDIPILTPRQFLDVHP